MPQIGRRREGMSKSPSNGAAPAKRVSIVTLGCKVNQAESETLERQLLAAGCLLVEDGEPADICIVNSCAVTQMAERKMRQAVRQARRRSPQGQIVLTGCAASLEGLPAQLPELDKVVSNDEKLQLPRLLGLAHLSAREEEAGQIIRRRTRSFLAVQTGCNNHCSYCIVPRCRGPQRSRPLPEVVEAVARLVDAGFKEVVLTGIHVGAYGRDGDSGVQKPQLPALIGEILGRTALERLRLTSLDPVDLTPGLVALWRQHPGRLCPHFHLPLQSGCDATLAAMRRRYNTGQYEEKVTLLRASAPDVAITTDVMVGFPGESEEDFEQSYQFVQRQQFAGIHVFRFSRRQGTPAASMPQQVSSQIMKARSRRMLALAKRSSRAFASRHAGRTVSVLFEEQVQNSDGRIWLGHTGNYLKVYVNSETDLQNRLVDVSTLSLYGDGLLASLAEDK